MKTEKKNQISKITKKYLGSRFAKETEEKVQQWLIDDEDSKEKEQASLEYWDELNVNRNLSTYKAFKRVASKIGISPVKTIIPLGRRLLRYAAIVIPALIFIGGAYHFSQKEQMIHVVTAYGQTKEIILPDNSKVWLNSGSSIEYPRKFKKNSRIVSLEGEAYFSVRKNSSKPFVVETDKLSISVLGTEFNVKAYIGDTRTIATLNSGKIEVNTSSGECKILEPNQQLIYNNITTALDIKKVPANDISAWKTGLLAFTNTPFDEIIETLERRFNVTFESVNIVHSSQGYTVKFRKDDSLEYVLNILEDVIGDFAYHTEGSKITIINK